MKYILFSTIFLISNFTFAQEEVLDISSLPTSSLNGVLGFFNATDIYLCNNPNSSPKNAIDWNSDGLADLEVHSDLIERFLEIGGNPQNEEAYVLLQAGQRNIKSCYDQGGSFELVIPFEIYKEYDGCFRYECSIIDESKEECRERINKLWLEGFYNSYKEYLDDFKGCSDITTESEPIPENLKRKIKRISLLKEKVFELKSLNFKK